MRDVAIIGAGMIPFGRRDEDSLMEMLAYASLKALDDAGLGDKSVDAVYLGNMGGGIIQHQTSIASSLVDRLNLLPAAAETVENGPASGGSAVKNGLLAVASGYYDYVLVVGGEKMREVTGWRATDFVATMTHPQVEYPYGITLPGMAGMFTRLYMEKYGVTREHLLAVSLKNQEMGALNPYAHVEMTLDREGIFDSPHAVVNNPTAADPLHLYDMCPVSDGAAAIVICPLEMAKKLAKPPCLIAGFGQATDTHTLQERDDPTDLKAVTLAAQKAFEMAKLKPSDIQRGRAARCFHHPGDCRERACRFLQERRRRKSSRSRQDTLWRTTPDQCFRRAEGARSSSGSDRRGSGGGYHLATTPRAAQEPAGEECPEWLFGQLRRLRE